MHIGNRVYLFGDHSVFLFCFVLFNCNASHWCRRDSDGGSGLRATCAGDVGSGWIDHVIPVLLAKHAGPPVTSRIAYTKTSNEGFR